MYMSERKMIKFRYKPFEILKGLDTRFLVVIVIRLKREVYYLRPRKA
jgi:hypothetical protein